MDENTTDATDRERRQREAEEFGCYGLVGGFAKQLRTQHNVSAFDVTKTDGPFFCSVCYSDAIVRKCIEKRDHFAHDAPRSPAIGPGESALHEGCKKEVCSALKAAHPDGKWEVERPIRENKEHKLTEVRPDISGRIDGVDGMRLVIEVQASALSITQILKRTAVYSKRNIPILWVVPLKEPLTDALFRPRLYERYFHSIYFGRTYYWWPGLGATLLPVHYGVASRHIPLSEWYEEGGELVTAGDYDKDYKAIKRPVFGPMLDISTGFGPTARDEFTPDNERKAVPSCQIWLDTRRPWWSS